LVGRAVFTLFGVGRGVRCGFAFVGRGVLTGFAFVGRGVFSLIGLGVFSLIGRGVLAPRVGRGVFDGFDGVGLGVLDGLDGSGFGLPHPPFPPSSVGCGVGHG